MTTHSLADLDRQSLLHPFTSIADQQLQPPFVPREGRGLWLRDAEGREYLDAMSGLWCVNAGYGQQRIVDAMAEQAVRLPYYHAFAGASNEPAIRCAAKLLERAPVPMARVFFGVSGSDANETQIKLVWYYNNLRGKPGKKKIVARRGGFHGSTVAAASLTGLPYVHAHFDLPIERMAFVSRPHYYRDAPYMQSERDFSRSLAAELEETLLREGPETVAAFIAEPVMGAGGVIVPPEGYFEEIQPVLERHDVLLIADEVICGFGRLGAWFGTQRFGLRPDLITIAKGVTSGYAPLSAALISERVFSVLREGSREAGFFGHGYTYSAHPVSAAAALANLSILEEEKLVERAAERGALFQRRLREAIGDHARVGEVRGLGLMAGIELVADRETKAPFPPAAGMGSRLARLLLEEGLIVRALRDTIALAPALVIQPDEIEEIVARLARGLARLQA
jgi:L-2,4-diaminobutyrate transaminase